MQNTTKKTKDKAIRTPLQTEVNSCAPEGQSVRAPYVAPVVLRVTRGTNPVINQSWIGKVPDYEYENGTYIRGHYL